MKTNSKLILATIIGFVAGCAAGFFFKPLETTADSAKGDIAKVSRFSKSVVSPAMSAFQEKIINNPEELEKATFSLTVLTSRMTEFDELVNIATAVSEGNEELAASVNYLQRIKQLASNARISGNQALEALNAIAEGKKSSVDYEQASQNLAIAYLMVDRQINVGKQYVCDVDAFLRGKNVEDYKDLALVRDLWAGYCTGEAVLNSDDEELAYWQKQKNLLPESTAVLSLQPDSGIKQLQEFGIEKLESYDFSVLEQSITVDNIIGLNASSQTLEAVDKQSFIIGNTENFRQYLNMTETGLEQLISNSTPSVVDEGVLVVPATDGPMPQTREHILL